MSLTKDPETGTKPNVSDYINEKSQPHLPNADVDGNHTRQQTPSSWSTMPSVRYALVLLLLLASIAVTFVAASPPHRYASDAQTDPSEQSSFAALLSSVSDASLHEVLHKCGSGKYQHGTYPEDRTAISAVQKENAPLATSIIELAKRQTNSSTSASGSVSTITTTTTPLTTVTTTSTNSETVTPGGTETTASESSSGSAAESTADTGSDSAAPSSAVTTSALVSTVTQGGSTFVTTTGSSVISSAGGSPGRTTSKAGSSSGSGTHTTGGSQSSYTTELVYTTTLPNGARSTITSTTVVIGEPGVVATATGPTGTPALQNASGKNSMIPAWVLVATIVLALCI